MRPYCIPQGTQCSMVTYMGKRFKKKRGYRAQMLKNVPECRRPKFNP